MTDRFESVLDESISALQAGVPIDEILAEAPDYANELRPLLYAAMVVADPNPDFVPEEKRAALRTQYLTQVAELPPVTPTVKEKIEAILRIVRRRLKRRTVLNDLITVSVTIILTLVMSALMLSYAASGSLPGDFLYGVKRISENISLFLTFDEENHAALEESYNQQRIVEIEQLMEQNRAAVVQFRGVVDTKGENLWVIEGMTVFLPDDITIVQGNPQAGDTVEVIGLLRTNNILIADTIEQVLISR